jgi:hypothetical protein
MTANVPSSPVTDPVNENWIVRRLIVPPVPTLPLGFVGIEAVMPNPPDTRPRPRYLVEGAACLARFQRADNGLPRRGSHCLLSCYPLIAASRPGKLRDLFG